MEEIWKDVPGYEGEYLVSNYARFIRVRDGRFLKPCKNYANYDVISFRKKQFRVARVVCMAFNPNPDNLPFVDHIDTNRSNNCAWNLRWCTAKGNAQNPISRKHWSDSKRGPKNPNYGKVYTEEERMLMSQHRKGRPLTEEWRRHKFENRFRKNVLQYSESGILIKKWDSMTEASRAYEISMSKMSVTCNGIDKRPRKGYYWCFSSDTERIKEIESLKPQDSSPKLF